MILAGPPVNARLLPKAARIVIATQFGSAGLIARRLGIGAARARDLMLMLEERGIVGPAVEGRSRDVLVRADRMREVLADLTPTEGGTDA